MPSFAESPAVTYIVASTMRTGSYLLCEGLTATGRAGHPREVFCPERRENYAGEWQLPRDVTFVNFLREAIRKGTTENRVLGIKIHWHHVEPLAREGGVAGASAEVLPHLFPGAKYIHLSRRDRRAQAISWYRAEVTNQWWRIPGVDDWDLTGKEPLFDAGEIRRREIELDRQQLGWDRFFATQPGAVLTMDYETLAANYRGKIAQALEFIGQDPALAEGLPEPRMARQSDALSDEWHRLMDAEYPE